jgi:preprotein translocase subunit SecA
VVARTAALEPWAAGFSDQGLREAAQSLGKEIRAVGFRRDPVARVFALVREAATRHLGQRHFDVQILGGRALLAGLVAEMETGEGKTLTATLPAAVAALAGIPVHVVTVNDYLAARDAADMGPVYGALGLRVGVIVHGLSPAERRTAYGCDVTYCTNKEVAFDYLRDRIVLGPQATRLQLQLERLSGEETRAHRLVLRGLHYAIVDEADSVLVDEARTPLIISGPGDGTGSRRVYEEALALAEELREGAHFVIERPDRGVRLTAEGEARLAERARPLGGVWAGRLRREDLARQALTARHLLRRDHHYLVAEGKVQIIDEYTGRLTPDRSWELGLHQLIEVKEGCAVTSRHDALARISYQRFFRRYLRLAGMTGTAREVAGELWSVYRLAVARIPTNRPLRRRRAGARVFVDGERRWTAVVDRVAEIHAAGRPVLLGTRSVAASEHLSDQLTKVGLSHRVLNARDDREEAAIVAQAGQPGQVTVATNMAGRGTDIRLGHGVAEQGGLHVIATELHDAGRIDRQLFGRCARQGDPGTYEALISLGDELLTRGAPRWAALAALLARRDGRVLGWLGLWAARRGQRRAERRHAQMRRDLVRLDEQLARTLAFSGGLE